jgi:hypothetical protein
MLRSQELIVRGAEIEKLFNLEAEYDHEQVGRREYGKPVQIKATLRSYRVKGVGPRQGQTIKEVLDQLISFLRENGHIPETDTKVMTNVVSSHSWGAFDDMTETAPSVYSHHVNIILKSESITIL